MSTYAIGIDLGGTNLKAALVEQERGVREHIERPTEADEGPEHVVERLIDAAREMKRQAPDGVAGIGIGSPGAINWDRTTVSDPPNLPGWTSVNLHDALQSALNVPVVVVENDANVAGLGSAHYGAGTPYDDFIMITLGTGVGGAIIYQNQIFRGSSGGAGEIGHLTIDYEGAYANSGVAGALEGYLGQSFLSEHARARLVNYPDSCIYDLVDGDLSALTPRTLYEAATRDDEAGIDLLAWAGHKLGCGLGAAVNLLDIRTVVVGGGVSAAGDYILEPARKALAHYVVPALRDDLVIARETMGNEVSLLGAARLAFDADEPSPS
ncbi:ROK family protein [Salisaeta longa]|uniref:ROK family protein n=1 Tax=Salisaeta longa TaxID=503170 RepID=UPI0003B36049|nr:ROK family protein [Salisaeta longa]